MLWLCEIITILFSIPSRCSVPSPLRIINGIFLFAPVNPLKSRSQTGAEMVSNLRTGAGAFKTHRLPWKKVQ